MRLIDADKLNLWTALRPYCSSDVCCEVTDIINNAPTVSIENVVNDECYFVEYISYRLKLLFEKN